MGSQIQISSPFVKSFTHTNTTVGTSVVQILDYAPVPAKRIALIIQNQSSTANVYAIFNSTDTNGVLIPPLGSFILDNYNGQVYTKASAAGTVVHTAEAKV